MKPICENIGLNWDSQRQRIQRHPILSKGTVMITAPSKGGLQEMLMLPLKMLNGWLFGVDSNRVKPEIKDAVIKYQEGCFDVLANHFMPKAPATPFITEKEARLLQKAIVSVAAGSQSKSLYTKLYDGYGITTYHHVPAGKLNEAMVFLGLQPPEMPKNVLVNSRYLAGLEHKAKALPVSQIPEDKLLVDKGFHKSLVEFQFALPVGNRTTFYPPAGIVTHTIEDFEVMKFKDTQFDKLKGVFEA